MTGNQIAVAILLLAGFLGFCVFVLWDVDRLIARIQREDEEALLDALREVADEMETAA